MKPTLTLLTALLLAPMAALHAQTMSDAAHPAKRSPGSPKYDDICFSPRTTSAGKRDVVEVAKAFHATRIEWLYVDESDGPVLQKLRDLGKDIFLIAGPELESVLRYSAIGFTFWLVVYWMYRNKFFVRIC